MNRLSKLARRWRRYCFVLCVMVGSASADEYDPLRVSQPFHVIQLSVAGKSEADTVPLKVYLPELVSPAPVVLFSHGLAGSRDNATYLGEHWSRRGYVVVAMQHTLSDSSLLAGKPREQWLKSAQAGINKASFMQRMEAVPAVLDALEHWNGDESSPLFQRLRLDAIGMSGHSYGAITTQAVTGQRYFGKPRFQDKRIDAALALSPSAPSRGSVEKAFAGITLPWMLMTGTRDVVKVGSSSLDDRLAVFPALPADGRKFELVLDGAEHYAFNDSDDAFPGRVRNPNHHRAIRALSTAFWDAYLRADADAVSWLMGPKAESVLEPADRWQHK